MNHKAGVVFLLLASLMLMPSGGVPTAAGSQQVKKWHIAVLLWHESPNDLAALKGLKRGLAAMKMGQNVFVLKANADEKKAKQLLKKTIADGVDLIVALGTRSAKIAAAEVKTCPIVFTAVTNPVLSGITPSWTGSGRNIAGNSNWLDRREMLTSFRQALPTMKKLCVLRSPSNSVSQAEIAEAHNALPTCPGLELEEIVVKDPKAVGKLLAEKLSGVDAVWVPIDFPLYQIEPLKQIIQETRKRRIPVFSSTARCAGAGALLVLTVDYELLGLKASSMIRDILVRGRNPSAIEVGRMKSSRLFVDLEAARHIGLKPPFDLILNAHRLFGAGGGK
ncbi:MAG: putative ABC transport system substrate-binding protein [Planctomycetota bacterium]|jgi:putative ABC transport system substrate-binding protein